MKLKIEGYTIEVCNVSGKLNLYKSHIPTEGKMAGKEIKTGLSYGMDMNHIIKVITMQELAKGNDVSSYSEFLEAYHSVNADVCKRIEAAAKEAQKVFEK